MAVVPSADEVDGDVDMDNFMVLDSVGSGDGQSSYAFNNKIKTHKIIYNYYFVSLDEGSEEGENAQDGKDDGKKKSKSKKEISLGKL